MAKDPFPGSPVTEGKWGSINEGHELIWLGGQALDWEPASGRFRLWDFERNCASKDPFPGDALTSGEWGSIRTGHELVFLGGDRVLDWEPASGNFRVWRYDANARGKGDPFPGDATAKGSWASIRTGHKLIYMYNNRVLDWVPATGEFKIWNYDRNATSDPFPGSAVVQGKWGSINSGHELIYLEQGRLLDWEPASGRYRVWKYEESASGDPLPGDALTTGEWGSIRTGHKLICMGGNEVLDWTPATGAFRLWKYDRSI